MVLFATLAGIAVGVVFGAGVGLVVELVVELAVELVVDWSAGTTVVFDRTVVVLVANGVE